MSREGIQRSQERSSCAAHQKRGAFLRTSPEIFDFWCANETLRVSVTPHKYRTRLTLGPQAYAIENLICVVCVLYGVTTRKNISIRDDQEEWIQENHLSLSSFVQEKLDELIEERS